MQTGKFALLGLWTLSLLASPLSAQQVIINEILYDTPGDDDPCLLFTELWGPPGVSLSGWTLVGICGSGATYRSVRLSGVIPADGYFVVDSVDWMNAGSISGDDCDGVQLYHGSEVADQVCYGICAPGHVCIGEGGTNAPDAYPVGFESYSIARCPNGEDTDNSGLDWAIALPTPGQANRCPCRPQNYTLSQIQDDNADGTPAHEGEFVSIRGIATAANYIFDAQITDFYIQDDSAGVNILGSLDPVTVFPGDCLLVEGWVAHTCGLTQIASSGPDVCIPIVNFVSHADVPGPIRVNCHDIRTSGETYEGRLVILECVAIVGGDPWPVEGQDADITVADQSDLCTIHIDKDTDIDGQSEPDGHVAVVGIVGQHDCTSPFTEEHYVLPRNYSDLTACSGVIDSPLQTPQEFKLIGCFPNPFNTKTRIVFTVAHPAVVSVYIFDLLGRQVVKASVAAFSPGEHSYIWDGTNAANEIVSAGLYFVQIKTSTESATGKLLYLK